MLNQDIIPGDVPASCTEWPPKTCNQNPDDCWQPQLGASGDTYLLQNAKLTEQCSAPDNCFWNSVTGTPDSALAAPPTGSRIVRACYVSVCVSV